MPLSQPSDHALRQWRIENKLTLQAVAEKTGATTAAISLIERRRVFPTLHLLKRLIAVTEIPAEAFFPP
jgi:transcriptional regulator with XRE-family HTH domain